MTRPSHASTTLQQRSARWLLAAWWLVLLVSVVGPWARAQASIGAGAVEAAHWERVCTASGQELWLPSPVAGAPLEALPDAESEAPLGNHGLECALCLPGLAPPPAQPALTAQGVAPLRALGAGSQWLHVFASTLPPVRAPPL